VDTFIEVGPHPALVRDITTTLERLGAPHLVVNSLRRNYPLATSMHRSLARLYTEGFDLAWDAVLGDPPGRVPLPRYPWDRRRHWLTIGGDSAAPPAAVAAPVVVAEPVDAADRVAALTMFVRERIAEALGHGRVVDVPADVPLEQFALDSLVIVELKNRVEKEFGLPVSLQQLLVAAAGGTVTDLARAIAGDTSAVVEGEAR
jgi:acyl transferase domain-containing protein